MDDDIECKINNVLVFITCWGVGLMKRVDIVYEKLKKMAQKGAVSTIELAESLNLNRANVSSDLNKLWKAELVRKTDTRPVLYLPFENEQILTGEKKTYLDKFVKDNRSLSTAVEQAKAALLYPPKGMHSLILGKTGVGKTMFAGMMHMYAIEMKKIEEDAPFITFNCADYSNNPQLLTSQLFGVKKGAYTGADFDRIGLIEKANGGILFLDEVHRLPVEGQEMFFTFMDKGIFRRLGETEMERKANVLIISATTENPESSLLRTFTRRIPMIIRIPALSERSAEERFELIKNFFKRQSILLKKKISVSSNAVRSFLSYNCTNNIGQLESDIKLACAKVYADFICHRRDNMAVKNCDLPEHVREALLNAREHREKWASLIGINNNYIIFCPNTKKEDVEVEDGADNIYEMIENKVNDLIENGVSDEEIEKTMEKDIRSYFTRYLNGVDESGNKYNNIIDPDIVKLVDEVLKYSETKLNRIFSQKVYLGMALHVSNTVKRIKMGRRIINPHLNKVRIKYKEAFNVALACTNIIERKTELVLPIDEAGFLTMFFVLDEEESNMKNDTVGVIVIAHGDSVATSMVDVANKLLGVEYAVAINASLDLAPQSILSKVREHIKQSDRKKGYIFLVDMGSLLTFGEVIEKEIGIPVKTVDFVCTPFVIEAARKAMLGYTLDEIYDDIMKITHFDTNTEKSRFARKKQMLAIVTACLTGEGSAVAIKSLLDHHVRIDKELVEIIPLNIVGKVDIEKRIRKISEMKKVVCIVSPFNIRSKIPQFNLSDVLNLRAIDDIQYLVDIEVTYLKLGDNLKYHIKNVDSQELIFDIKKCIATIEKKLRINLDSGNLIGIILHISCMVDRLLSNELRVEYKEKDKYISDKKELFFLIRGSLKTIEKKYKMKIYADEVCYIMNFFDCEKQ